MLASIKTSPKTSGVPKGSPNTVTPKSAAMAGLTCGADMALRHGLQGKAKAGAYYYKHGKHQPLRAGLWQLRRFRKQHGQKRKHAHSANLHYAYAKRGGAAAKRGGAAVRKTLCYNYCRRITKACCKPPCKAAA